jgi:hypothetical protein
VVFAIVVTERLVGTQLSHTSRNLVGGSLVATGFAFGVIEWLTSAAARGPGADGR